MRIAIPYDNGNVNIAFERTLKLKNEVKGCRYAG